MWSVKFTRGVAIALSVTLVTALPSGAMANKLAENLAKTETRGLSSVSRNRLKDLSSTPMRIVRVSANSSAASEVVFSRSWLASQPRAKGTSEFECLAEALYFEARGETVRGQFAVAEVIRNRVRSKRFPNSYCAVINEGTGKKYQCQFTYTCDGRPEIVAEFAAYARVAKVARATIDGKSPDITNGATFYHTTAVRPSWSRKFTNTARFGVHLFYSRGARTASN